MNYFNERFILAAQNEGLLKDVLEKILNFTTNDGCKFWKDSLETVDLFLSGCLEILAKGKHTTRHNNVCRVINRRLCQKYGFQTPDTS